MQSIPDQVLSKAQIFVEELFDSNVDPRYVYHSYDHTLRVHESATLLGQLSNIADEDLAILQLSALFHDSGFSHGPVEHESRGIAIATNFLKSHEIADPIISRVGDLISATKMGIVTDDKLAQILQDADISGLGTDRYFEYAEDLRIEKNSTEPIQISRKDWNLINIQFLKECKFKTIQGKKLYQDKKMENLQVLLSKSAKKKIKKIKEPSISNNKSAQTQFKTALRNHIDLSNIADNKANIMISVNALIITVALPFLIDKSIDNQQFWIPTMLLGAVTLTSMIFATLATRPIPMSGMTSQEDIKKKKSNLFFFGNYYKMEYEAYKEGIKEIVSDTKLLDDSIIKDLYSLGRSLGKKFSHLRLCYNIFMYGISAIVFSFVLIYLRS